MYMPKQRSQEDMVRSMLREDRDDTIEYIRDQLSLNGLRSATQNLQALCNIVYQTLASGNIIGAYKIANTVAMGFHDNLNIFQEIKRDAIEKHIGHIYIPKAVNLDLAYFSDKLTETKSDYLVEAVANMLGILNLTAHILSRKNVNVHSKHIIVAMSILRQAQYEPCMDIVKATDMNRIWNKIVPSARDTIIGPSEWFITMDGETHICCGHDIRFCFDGVFSDDTAPMAKHTNQRTDEGIPYCALFYANLDAWLYFTEAGWFNIRSVKSKLDLASGKLSAPSRFSKAIYQRLVA